MAQIKPTRTELIKLRAKIKLAKSGYNLLKKKRDGLILEFFEVLKKAKTIRSDLVVQYNDSLNSMNIARLNEGDSQIKSIAKAIIGKPEFTFQNRNIVGVVVPKIHGEKLTKSILERGYGIYTPATINDAASKYEKLVEHIIKVAEVETTLRRLLTEIEKTKRRVNALEFTVIPSLEKTKSIISLRLQEMERDNFVRLRLIKARLAT